MTDPTDTMQPWTIKSLPTRTRDTVVAAAKREGLTVGQWLERRVGEWEAAGSPVPVPTSTGPAPNLGDLAAVMQAARALADAAGVPVPPHLARDALATVKLATRQVRGLPPPVPRRKPAPYGNALEREE